MIKKILTSIIIYQLTFSQAILMAAEGSVNNVERNDNRRDGLQNGSAPTDIPYLGYSEYFMPEHVKIIDKQDLGSYTGKNVYVGYGIYDQADDYCKFVDLPNPPPENVKLKFKDFKTFNNRSYGVLRSGNTNFNTCKQLAIQYGGKVATPENLATNAFIGSYKLDNWLGIHKTSCSALDYTSIEGEPLAYTNWSDSEESGECFSSKLNVSQNIRKTWNKVSSSDLKACIIEIASPYPDRPIKMCAPWWRVERTYTKPESLAVNGLNLGNINQADIPELYNVCTKVNSEAVEAIDNNKTHEFHCTTYFDATQAPECLRDPMQNQCKVDECKGFVEDSCKHMKSITPLKDYTKIIKLVNGVQVETKGKVHIRTEVYECPLVVPSKSDCLERSSVLAYPKECPGSQCQEKRECYDKAINSDDIIKCDQTFNCEKIYPNPNTVPQPSDMNGNELKFMRGKCADGTELQFPVNIQNKKERTCTEYSEINVTKQIKKKCNIDKKFQDIVLNMSITDEDIYEDDPDCVRTNNISDSRPINDILIDIDFFNFAKNKVTKFKMDNPKEIIAESGTSDYLYDMSTSLLKKTSSSDTVQENSETNSIGGCPLVDNSTSAELEDWSVNKLEPMFEKNMYQTSYSSSKVLISGGSVNVTDCSALASSLGGSVLSSSGTTCKILRDKRTEDTHFSKIESIGSFGDPSDPDRQLRYTSMSSSYSVEQCQDWASCLDATGVLNAGNKCVATEVEPTEDEDSGVEPIDEQVSSCKPEALTDQKRTTVNGLTDIFLIEDSIKGNFGYASNYVSHPYQTNMVKMNGKEVFPIVQNSVITDVLSYISKIKQRSYISKKPRILGGLLTGTSTEKGLLYAEIFLGAAGVIVALLIAYFGKKQKFYEESIYWMVYKDIPKLDYVKGPNDHRIAVDMDTFVRVKYGIGGDDPGDQAQDGFGWANYTGTLKKGNTFDTYIANMFKKKQQQFTCMGFDISQTPKTNKELGYELPSFKSCKWYHFSCDKKRLGPLEVYETELRKKMNGFYLGADNTISIVTPYIGDYEIIAYNKYNEALGKIDVRENDFINETSSTMSYAQLNFGKVMDLANGLSEGLTDGACRDVQMVEFGGGVSGIYFENNNAGGVYEADCEKSNDNYVRDHSITTLEIRPKNQEDSIKLVLERPMPYANRIKLVTMGEKEIRKYRCYLDFSECVDDDFITQETN